MTTKAGLITQVTEGVKTASDKVTVVGCGMVGCATVITLLCAQTSSEIAMVDMDGKRLEGESLDFQHAALHFNNAKVHHNTDYSVTEGSRVCVVTAGVRQKEGESRLDLVQRNTDVLKTIIPNLVKYSPNTIIVMVSNPCDILTYVAWKLSGLPRNRVFGTGTSLDSARFRAFLGEKLGVAAESINAYILGEHGDTSVAAWSSITVGGTKLKDINPQIGEEGDPDNFKELHNKVISAAGDVIKLKGYTSWAIGAATSHVVRAILKNSKLVEPISTFVKGHQGIEQDVVLSVPCVLGENGVEGIVNMTITCPERSALHKSAKTMDEVQQGIKF